MPIRLPPAVLWELESRLMLVYTGARHLSSEVHRKVVKDLQAGHGDVPAATEELRQTPETAAGALWRRDFTAFAAAMDGSTRAQTRLHPDIATPGLAHMETVAGQSGGIGFKIDGAGGGGSARILCDTGARQEVKKALREAGFQPLNFHFDREGLRTWVAQS